jgi:two-component system, response regulator PdtaR
MNSQTYAPETAARGDAPPLRPHRVLVAEDEHLVATNLTMMLGDLGYTVLLATDGQEAVEMARTGKPDIVLMDIRMPRRDGLSAAKEMYEELGVPVVILSAYSESAEVNGAQQAGVFGYMVKPVQREQLRVGLDIAWHRFQLHQTEAHEARKLRKRLDERRIIEQAKWAMVSSKSMSEPDAMKALQKRARDSRTQLVDIATAVLKELGAA